MLVVLAFIKPALPMTAESPPCGPEDAAGTRLLTRNGYDWAQKYPLIVEAVNHLRVRSCLIDGEAAAATKTGLLCSRRCAGGERTRGCVYAFDLLELDGKDMRRELYEVRKATSERPTSGPPRATDQRAPGLSRRHGLPARVQDGPRRHRI